MMLSDTLHAMRLTSVTVYVPGASPVKQCSPLRSVMLVLQERCFLQHRGHSLRTFLALGKAGLFIPVWTGDRVHEKPPETKRSRGIVTRLTRYVHTTRTAASRPSHPYRSASTAATAPAGHRRHDEEHLPVDHRQAGGVRPTGYKGRLDDHLDSDNKTKEGDQRPGLTGRTRRPIAIQTRRSSECRITTKKSVKTSEKIPAPGTWRYVMRRDTPSPSTNAIEMGVARKLFKTRAG